MLSPVDTQKTEAPTLDNEGPLWTSEKVKWFLEDTSQREKQLMWRLAILFYIKKVGNKGKKHDRKKPEGLILFIIARTRQANSKAVLRQLIMLSQATDGRWESQERKEYKRGLVPSSVHIENPWPAPGSGPGGPPGSRDSKSHSQH